MDGMVPGPKLVSGTGLFVWPLVVHPVDGRWARLGFGELTLQDAFSGGGRTDRGGRLVAAKSKQKASKARRKEAKGTTGGPTGKWKGGTELRMVDGWLMMWIGRRDGEQSTSHPWLGWEAGPGWEGLGQTLGRGGRPRP